VNDIRRIKGGKLAASSGSPWHGANPEQSAAWPRSGRWRFRPEADKGTLV